MFREFYFILFPKQPDGLQQRIWEEALDTPAGRLHSLKERLADAQRALRRTRDPLQKTRAQSEIDDLRQEIRRQEQIAADPQGAEQRVKESIARGLERERQPECPVAGAHEIALSHVPNVFLCHAKENRDYAVYLRERLKSDGFNAWFDEEDLCGGDEWERIIERAIKKEIDYFVVLQSRVMSYKRESFFHREIKLALERQANFKLGIRFIIPVKIEECPQLEELEHLQHIALLDKINVGKLISTLKRDQQRRKRK